MKTLLAILFSCMTVAAFAGHQTGTWPEPITHQFFPVITRALMGNGYAVVSTQAFFGDCSDGDVTISANTQLSRDMFYNNLTINSGAIVDPNGFRVFVCNTFDISNPGYIQAATDLGGNGGGGGTAGSAGTNGAIGTMNRGLGGASGGSGTALNGNPGNSPAGGNSVVGVSGGAGGNGGNGAAGTGGTGGAAAAVTALLRESFATWSLPTLGDSTAIAISSGSGSGGGGGGGSVQNGAGGGGGGSAGGAVWLTANIIKVSASTSLAPIQAPGGNGGNGNTPSGACTLGCGGGGGGGGGAGGLVVIRYLKKIGPAVFIAYTGGGVGGTGGNGKNGGTAGTNGANGTSGLIYLYDMSIGSTTKVSGGLAAL